MPIVRNSAVSEIETHRQQTPEPEWLAEVGLIDTPADPYHINLVRDWEMPGSESYILEFKVESNLTRHVLAKACVKLCAAATVEEWMSRREVIQRADISVPRLYSVHRADYIEEYIPYTLREAYTSGGPDTRTALRQRFIETYQGLFTLGFHPLSLHDVRSRGDDVVIIDLGSDLGSPAHGTDSLPADLSVRAELEFSRLIT